MKNVVVAFLPVIHRGVFDFLKEANATTVYTLKFDDVEGFEHLGREVRALTTEELSKLLRSVNVEVLPFSDYKELLQTGEDKIVMPDEDITRAIANKFFATKDVHFIPTFQRWDWARSTVQANNIPEADRVIKKIDLDGELIRDTLKGLNKEATKSSDWWRQVAAMVLNKEITLIAYNKHMPNEYVPYIDGDPRQNFKPGEFNEIYTSLHAEKGVISQAARHGVSLDGAEMYVTTFPCNDCANQIVEAGIKKLFFTGGYSNLNGVKTLREHGVELVYVEL